MFSPANISPHDTVRERSAVLDDAHLGDIKGALGTIAHHDVAPRTSWWARFRTLLAILGPGLIVMVGDNDAGAFGTYTQAGQNYGTTLLWTMLLLVPVLVSIHPPVGQMARDFFIPNWPAHSKLSDVMLLVIGIVGTTVAPWQLFFQQSYVVDKRITPRFMKYEKADLWIGIAFVLIGAVAMIAFCAQLFAGKAEFGNFTDAGGIIAGLDKYAGHTAAVLFAIALFDAAVIGAAAVSLSTAYAIGDVFRIRHSLHRSVTDAKGFYLVYFGIIAAAAAIVLIPGSPLGLLTEAVQTLAGVLLPSATVFLLLLCNDRAVLGPWVNSKKLNLFTGAVIWVLVMLSIILTASVLYPDMAGETILELLAGGTLLAIVGYAATVAVRKLRRESSDGASTVQAWPKGARDTWRMPPLDELPPPNLTLAKRVWMGVLRGYLLIAVALVVVKVVQMTFLK
ncbi:NRAMP family divalent metal transporter [Burkholderia ubonensis]|uniref:Manganese transporter n=1 Tax=Burkholderia ubonensis subsp. mesacidophila TaxID=265293 RepID=A0A2A4FIR9_9BURK|nr:divalent metal cation transporter [Burkholderia ubonensis]PCE32504.1 manganese transporter [Burkholderia ubonensis subsp. mesacidophila]